MPQGLTFTEGGWATSNPIQAATRNMANDPRRNQEDPWGGISSEVRLQARLQALKEMLAEIEPWDTKGIELIENEMSQIEAQLSRQSAGINQRIGAINEQILHAQAQAAELEWGKELASLNPSASQEWGGMFDPTRQTGGGQYSPIEGRTAYTYGRAGAPGESLEYNPKGRQVYDWMKGVVTDQGLRPLLGDYALDPMQQRQTALQQTWNEYGKPNRIEDWLEVKPNVELVMEQWRQATEKSKPKRVYNTTNWLAAAAR